ncbi:Kinesin-like protein KIF15 [Geodia barretti]|uniref:Kinesin-like protein KIF15 n=1 Tax=Geodia barretti TaxID=519541 RepID=A0AA35XDU8_GEOBA|nr:Kinesin-like protein KIF15 [Geodia barretti]
MESSGDDSIRVFVRVRPPDPNLDGDLYHAHCVDVTSATSLSVQSRPEPKVFTFDHVAGMQTTQEDVFSAIGRPIIESCMCGYNGTIFAYGQTGSGKTFTMIGFEYLFSLINREIEKCGDLVEFLCKCSFLEIYNEQVFDLLDPASSGLHIP